MASVVAFAELLGCSCFSFLRGAAQPEEMVERSKELGLAALALCDRDGLYGAPRAFVRARELGQRVIVGAELSFPAPPRAAARCRRAKEGLVATKQGCASGAEPPVVALLALDHTGYSNLCQLITRAHADRPKGEAGSEPAWLAEHAAGLFAVVPAPHAPGGSDMPSSELLAVVCEAFGEHAALGIHRHLDGTDVARTELVSGWSARYGLPIVASSRPLCHTRARQPLADVLTCIRHGTTLDHAGTRLRGNVEAVLRSPATMRRLFRDHPGWVARSVEIADRSWFSLAELRYEFPCTLAPGETANGRLRRLTWEGAARRYPTGVPIEVRAQLEHELALIATLEKAPYFLSAWEIVEIARRRRILCQGRGSAANSAVCYVLGITAVDPARSSLLFERFMSAERDEPPDIDIDFEHERREEVIQEIYERYGRGHAAMVSEVIAYRGRSALREVGKAFGFSLEQVDRLANCIGQWDEVTKIRERVTEAGLDPDDERVRKVLALADELQGFPRHLSIHVGGFVLSARPLHEVAPIEPARMRGRTVIPWDKDDIDALGFFKVDVLGLGMLTAIRKALALIHADGGLRSPSERADDNGLPELFDPIDVLARIPAEDPTVYHLVSRGDTVGIFQIESRAQMAMLPRLRPRCFYDLVIEVAIVRPGPIQGGMVHPYLRRRNREEPAIAPHPDLEPILGRTLGVPLFQEQVMQIAITGAGYTAGQADQLRRDMAAWKKHGRLLRHRERLLEGFAKKGISESFSHALFEQIKGFGEYGFPESHAASFALLVYASAWQKAHYPAHFASALLNAQPMGFYSPSSIVQDVKRHGVEVRDVCVVASDWDVTLEPSNPGARIFPPLRLGFRLLKGLGQAAARRLLAARAERPFTGLGDFVRRSGLQRDDLDRLAQAGALESLVGGRRQALWRVRAPRTDGLFAVLEPNEPHVELLPLRAAEQLAFDYETKGLSVGDHPLRHLRRALRRRDVVEAAELPALRRGVVVAVAGLVTCRQQPYTANGVVFVTLEDETGLVNLIVYRSVFEQFRQIARHATILFARGKLERDEQARGEGSAIHVIVSELERLDRPGSSLRVRSRDFH
ncbi:MAG: error-prone DNA polymerase [Polyangiaceae bacterium]|nr:error-prone DNA polymerase [Polyangiaceae bacterium]